MRIPNIFTDADLSSNSNITLGEKEALHIVKALRMKAGFKLKLFNGDGNLYDAEIAEIGKKSLVVKTNESVFLDSESALKTHIGQVISRGDRMDYAIQKSTEMGVHSITPLFSERCEVKLDDNRITKRLEHWQQVAISACEQCGRASIPTIHAPSSINDWISSLKNDQADSLSLVFHHRDVQKLSELPHPKRVNMLIGPEGGLSETEINLAVSSGFVPTTLGPRVLRTETAPIAALGVLQWLWGDFQ